MADLDDILDRLRAGVAAGMLESSGLEFKAEDPSSPKRTLENLADAVVCLANSDGGIVMVGVADRPGQHGSLVGVSQALTPSVVVRGVFDRTRPSLSVPVHERMVAGVRLLVLTVPAGATFYANARGTATRRVGTECRPFPPEEQRQAMAARGLYDWSEQPSGHGLGDVSGEELNRVRRLLRAAGRDAAAHANDLTLLRELRLANAEGELARAGLLLVGSPEAIQDGIPTYGYSYQHRVTPGSETGGRLREGRPLLAAVQRLLDAVELRLSVHPLNTGAGVQLQLQDYPARAVRELVVNALVHRDYEAEGTVDIEHTPDQLTVSSPGGLVFGVTPQNILTHPSTPRNRLLLETVTVLQVAERLGQGVDRVYREVLRLGKPPPEIHDDEARVVVSLPGGVGNDNFARFVTSGLDDRFGGDLDVLLALLLLRARKTLTAGLLAPGIQRSPAEAQTVLERMVEGGIVEPSRRTARRPFPTYALTPWALTGLGRAVAYHRRDVDSVDEKVIEHVQEYGHITNQTLRRLFDLTVFQARDLLRDLQARQILRKIDQEARGPGVRYVAGNAIAERGTDARRRGPGKTEG